MTTAVVDFRTMQNGAYKYMRGKRRGFWRVLELIDVKGPTCINAKNVISVLATSPAGIDGVTERSAYYIGGYRQNMADVAAKFNAAKNAT